jgi:hypothetical protein
LCSKIILASNINKTNYIKGQHFYSSELFERKNVLFPRSVAEYHVKDQFLELMFPIIYLATSSEHPTRKASKPHNI